MAVLTASWVVPVGGPPLRRGLVVVEGGRVVRVAPAGEPVAEAPLDLGCGVLLPGLINAHCHLELSHLSGLRREAGGFVPWIERVVAERPRSRPEDVREAARRAIETLARRGTAAVGDVSNALGHLELLADSPLEAVVFFELLAWDPSRAPDALAAADARLASLPPGLAERGVRVRLAAHAPHSVSRVLFDGLRRRRGPAALHLAESPAETRFLMSGDGEWLAFLRGRGLDVPFDPPGVSPVRYADSLGILAPGVVAAHCVQVDAEDVGILARSGAAVALCPTSNRNLGVGLPPLKRMIEAGVRLALGTDSLASGDGLDLLQEAAALHAAFPEVEPARLVRMATLGGAEALGLPDLGTIAPGRRAVFAFAEADDPPEDPLAFLVSGTARRVTTVAP